MVSLYKCYVAGLAFELVTLDLQSGTLPAAPRNFSNISIIAFQFVNPYVVIYSPNGNKSTDILDAIF